MVLEVSDFMVEHRFIILVDIIGFSELSDEQQVKIIESINEATKDFIKNGGYKRDHLFTAFIPTGDGFYIIGSDVNSLFFGQVCVFFAVSLRNKVLEMIQSTNLPCEGIRTAINYGTTKKFSDILENTNFTGRGMNKTARLLSPINNNKITEISNEFYRHNNSIIISDEALTKIEENSLKNLKLSNPFILIAKHNKEISCRFVDSDNIYNLFST